jgi:uncharacterized protein
VKIALASLLSGLVFGAGLVISGMTEPAKVIGFLDVTGRWDPSLAFVMAGALSAHLVAQRVAVGRGKPIFAARFHFTDRTRVDAQLVVGSALFGVGWALSGMCPGPALTSLASAAQGPFLFVAMMAVGAIVGMKIEDRLSRKAAHLEASPAIVEPRVEDA